MDEAQRNECSFERLVMRLMDEAGLCAYGEDTGSYNVPVLAMLSRIGRIVEAAMQLGRDECISEIEALRADAERYRLLRRKVCIAGGEFHIINLDPRYIAPDAAVELDATIDAAIRKSEG
jgi:hypothetical protein